MVLIKEKEMIGEIRRGRRCAANARRDSRPVHPSMAFVVCPWYVPKVTDYRYHRTGTGSRIGTGKAMNVDGRKVETG
jgi:hypothetical protein